MPAQDAPFSELVLQLQTLVMAMDGKPIRHVDEEKGQLESYDMQLGRPAVSFPCLLVDFEDFEYNDIGNNEQDVAGQIVLRVGFPPFSAPASWFPQGYKVKGLKYFDIEHQLYTVLHGADFEGFRVLRWRKATTEKREDGIRVRVIRLDTGFFEDSAAPVKTTIPKPPVEITTELKTKE